MKTSPLATLAIYLCAVFALVAAQSEDPGPSPTASVGCVAHDDHWDCEGPRTPGAAEAAATGSITTSAYGAETTHSEDDHDDEEDHSEGNATADPGPSPTASVGCEAHGDHWDCEGPATAAAAETATSTTAAAPVEFTGAANVLGLDGGLMVGVAGLGMLVAGF